MSLLIWHNLLGAELLYQLSYSRENARLSGRLSEAYANNSVALNLSIRKGELSRLSGITSIATSLGATQVATKAFEWGQKPDVASYVITDPEAAMACVKFADDERIIVESACGASIATAYNDNLRAVLYPELSDEEFEKLNIVVIVCGGSNVTLEILERYREKYSQDDTVIEKFHSRRRSRQAQKITKVPFILHDHIEHRTKKDPICDNEVVLPRRPAVGILDKAEIDKQVEKYGKVVETKF
jgi:L-serine/L-threonine ammonia-lyase